MTTLKSLLIGFSLLILLSNIVSQTWVQQTSGTSLGLTCMYFINSNTGYIGGDSGKVLKTTNGGTNWFSLSVNTGAGFPVAGIKFFSSTEGIAAGQKIMKTTDSGATWFSIYDSAYAQDISCPDNNNWFISAHIQHPPNKKTTDGGTSWQLIPQSNIIQMCIFFINASTGWVAGKDIGTFAFQNVSKTTNGGSNWASQYSGIVFNGIGWFNDILFIDANTGFGAFTETSSNRLIRTTNGGTNWIVIPTTNFPRGIFFINGSTGWISCAYGKVMKTGNTGIDWFTEQTPVSTDLGAIYFASNETGWTCGAGGVILKTTNGGLTGLEPVNHSIPEDFSINQNYPNPFNPDTQIMFGIPKSSYVNITIYNGLGEEIENLVNENLSAGNYSVDWNASAYSSGIYFYKISAGEFTKTKKMVLVK